MQNVTSVSLFLTGNHYNPVKTHCFPPTGMNEWTTGRPRRHPPSHPACSSSPSLIIRAPRAGGGGVNPLLSNLGSLVHIFGLTKSGSFEVIALFGLSRELNDLMNTKCSQSTLQLMGNWRQSGWFCGNWKLRKSRAEDVQCSGTETSSVCAIIFMVQ